MLLSKTRSTPVRSPVPRVIPGSIEGPGASGSPIASAREALTSSREPASMTFGSFSSEAVT